MNAFSYQFYSCQQISFNLCVFGCVEDNTCYIGSIEDTNAHSHNHTLTRNTKVSNDFFRAGTWFVKEISLATYQESNVLILDEKARVKTDCNGVTIFD